VSEPEYLMANLRGEIGADRHRMRNAAHLVDHDVFVVNPQMWIQAGQ
jgi:hypothetical protein